MNIYKRAYLWWVWVAVSGHAVYDKRARVCRSHKEEDDGKERENSQQVSNHWKTNNLFIGIFHFQSQHKLHPYQGTWPWSRTTSAPWESRTGGLGSGREVLCSRQSIVTIEMFLYPYLII